MSGTFATVDAAATEHAGAPARTAAFLARHAVRLCSPAPLAATFVLVLGVVGADSRWLAVMGRVFIRTGVVPSDVPYAAAPSEGWHNATVLGQIVFAAVNSLGDRGLVLAQALAIAAAAALLDRGMRSAGSAGFARASVFALLVLGQLTSIVTVRAQMFSILFFPLLLLLLRRDQKNPSRRIWLVVPLLAVWANLHGGVLVGLGLTILYLARRARLGSPASLAVAVGAVGALSATPAVLGTWSGYARVLTGAAVTGHAGMWGPLSPTDPFDVLLVITLVLLGTMAIRSRQLSSWEVVGAATLAVGCVVSSRYGLWLALLLAVPAAAGLPGVAKRNGDPARRVAIGVAVALVASLSLARGPLAGASDAQAADAAATLAKGKVILAEPALAEQVAAAGGRVWLADPLDAFSKRDQRTYLAWVSGTPDGASALHRAKFVLVRIDSPSRRALPDDLYALRWTNSRTALYERRSR
jgi:hypothetical protein